MIPIVILLFALAIGLGLYLVYIGVRQHRGSPVLAITHAGVASVALVLLFVENFSASIANQLYSITAFLFMLALIGGVVLSALREAKKPPAMFLVMLHAGIGVIAFFLLINGYLNY